MPLPAETLTPNSTDEEISMAISESIKMCVAEGKDQKQCAAMAYDMARRATGTSVGGKFNTKEPGI